MRKTTTFRTMIAVIVMMMGNATLWAQVNISIGTPYSQNFDAIGSTATATLPTGWKMEGVTGVRTVNTDYTGTLNTQTANNTTYNTAMSSTAGNGIYNFAGSSATDRAIGGISSSSASKSVNTYLQLTNNGGSTISNFTISYDVERYRNGSNAAGFSIRFYYSTTGLTGSWTEVPEFLASFAANADNNGATTNPLETKNINKTLSQSLAAGSSIYLAWSYSVTSGTTTSNSQALGIDNVVITANSSAVTPSLTADATQNDVDHNIDITFTDDATWRAAITAVKVGATALNAADYTISSGNIQLKPSVGNTLLTTAGSKSISVAAAGYGDATVIQQINAGAPTANSTATMGAGSITCTAKDQYNNLVSGYTFKYDVTIINNNPTTNESYTLDGTSRSTTTTGISVVATTNASGVATFTAVLAPVIDPSDGISLQVKLNNGTTNVGSPFGYIQLQPQTITFSPLTATVYGTAPLTLSASASSSLPVTFSSSNPAIASVSGSTLTILAAGSVDITVSQAGDANYNAASSVTQTLVINKATLTIPDAVVSSKTFDNTNVATITGNLAGIINGDNVTVTFTGTFADVNAANGIAVTPTCTLGGSKAGNYQLTQPTGLMGNITRANQTITFGAISNKAVNLGSFTLGATASSGLAVAYASSNQNVATVSGNTVTILAVGSTDITAVQAGNGNYNAATNVIQSLTVVAGTALGNVIITEVYGGGGNSGTTYKTDFVELYNTTGANIDISGWSIQYYSTAGTGLCGNVFEIPAGKTIKAFSHFLVQGAAGGSGTTDIPAAEATCTLNFSGTGGKIILYNTNAAQTIDNTSIASITGNSSFMDYVPYGTSTPVWGTALAATTNTTSASRKYAGGSFVNTSNVGSDFEIVAPNPKNAGMTTRLSSTLTTLAVSASNGVVRVNAQAGETIEIYNALGQKLLMQQAVTGENHVSVSAKGLVVVKIGNNTAKVVL